MATPERHPATILEAHAAATPDRLALRNGSVNRTWAEFDDRAARFAGALSKAGVSRFGGVGLYLRNCNTYLEAFFGAYKVRALPVNINYRYLGDELEHLLRDSGCEVLVFHRDFAERVVDLTERVDGLKLLVSVGGDGPSVPGAIDFEELIAGNEPAAPIERSGGDPFIYYTGGTTGIPKGMEVDVEARLSPAAVANTITFLDLGVEPASAFTPALAAAIRERGEAITAMPLPPLMHATAMNALALPALLFGGTVVTLTQPSFDPSESLAVAGLVKATHTTISGDSMARPLLTALDEAAERGSPFNLPELRLISSSGMAWSRQVKRGILRRIPRVRLLEIYGGTEGRVGYRITGAGDEIPSPPSFEPAPGTELLRDDDSKIEPGSDEVGRIAHLVHPSMRYRGDAQKSGEVFRTIDGSRYSVSGDFGAYTADGSLRPAGRGSKVINTGGEKVYAEEVEAVIRELAGVVDTLIVGIPDERWGERVTALVARAPEAPIGDAEVMDAVRGRLAGYKVPKAVVFVSEVPRHNNGKADFDQAKNLAREAAV